MARSSPPYRRSDVARDRSAGPCRLGAKALITDGSQVLLIKERRSKGSSFWTLPGGGINVGETVRDGLRRELREELDCAIEIGDLVSTCTYDHETLTNTRTRYRVHDCRLLSPPSPKRTEGILKLAWYSPQSLPDDCLDPFSDVVSSTTGSNE